MSTEVSRKVLRAVLKAVLRVALQEVPKAVLHPNLRNDVLPLYILFIYAKLREA